MKRVALATLAALVMTSPARLDAQDTTAAQRRDTTAAATRTAAANPGLEAALTKVAEQRARVARVLLLTNDAVNDQQNRLRQLDAELLQAQLNLAAQRDQFKGLSEALQKSGSAMLVVLFRADSGAAAPGTFALSIDGANTTQRAYSDSGAAAALRAGATDEVFRGAVLPTAHNLVVSASVGGQSLSQTLRVNTAPDAVTYVEFAVRNGALVQTNWTGRTVSAY